jgi:hypothetical protein
VVELALEPQLTQAELAAQEVVAEQLGPMGMVGQAAIVTDQVAVVVVVEQMLAPVQLVAQLGDPQAQLVVMVRQALALDPQVVETRRRARAEAEAEGLQFPLRVAPALLVSNGQRTVAVVEAAAAAIKSMAAQVEITVVVEARRVATDSPEARAALPLSSSRTQPLVLRWRSLLVARSRWATPSRSHGSFRTQSSVGPRFRSRSRSLESSRTR